MTNKCILGFGVYKNNAQTEVDFLNILVRDNNNEVKIDDFLDITEKKGAYSGGNDTISLANANIKELIDIYGKSDHGKTVTFLNQIEEIQEDAFITIRRNDEEPNGVEEEELEYQASKLSK